MQVENGQSAAVYLYALLTRLFDLQLKNSRENVLIEDSISRRLLQIDSMLECVSDVSLSYIADQLHLSERQVSRFIKEQYNCSFREIILEKRMNLAKELLKKKLRISEISEITGYSSTKTFRVAFTKHVGVSPGKYLKSLR